MFDPMLGPMSIPGQPMSWAGAAWNALPDSEDVEDAAEWLLGAETVESAGGFMGEAVGSALQPAQDLADSVKDSAEAAEGAAKALAVVAAIGAAWWLLK